MKRFNCQYQAAFPHPAAAAQQSPPSWVDAAVAVQGRRARHTSTSERHLNSMKPTLNEVHESWEHHQHLSNAGSDQCTPAFEASHTFRDFYILFINVTSVKPGWIFVASSYPQGRALHKHPAQFLSLAVFLPQATTSSLLPPPGSRPPHFLSHKILSNLNPTEDIQLQSCMMLKSCLYVFDTCRVRYGYTRILYAMLHCICTNLISGTPQKHEVWKVHILAFFASSQNLSFSCRITLILMGNSVTSTPLGFLKSA